jgi:hypothetical protein
MIIEKPRFYLMADALRSFTDIHIVLRELSDFHGCSFKVMGNLLTNIPNVSAFWVFDMTTVLVLAVGQGTWFPQPVQKD